MFGSPLTQHQIAFLSGVAAKVGADLARFDQAGTYLDTQFGIDAVLERDATEEKEWRTAGRSLLKRGADGRPIEERELAYPDGIPDLHSPTRGIDRLWMAVQSFLIADHRDSEWRMQVRLDPPEAQAILFLTWLMCDRTAHERTPRISIEFQSIPWNVQFSDDIELRRENQPGRELLFRRLTGRWAAITEAAMTACEASGFFSSPMPSSGAKKATRRRGRQRKYDPRETTKLVADYKASALPPDDFCRERGISREDLIRAQRRLRSAEWRQRRKPDSK